VTAARQSSEVNDRAAEWVILQRRGALRPEQQQAFEAWLNSDRDHRIAYQRAEQFWISLQGLGQVAEPQMADARSYYRNLKSGPYQRYGSLAATVALVCAILWYTDIYSYINRQEYTTGIGERQWVQLKDGSTLDINTNSHVAVHYSRGTREILLLRGEALFNVFHADNRPFVVLAKDVKIRDIGTRFDVRHLAEEVTVAVLDGQVEVTPDSSGSPLLLSRGEGLSLNHSGELALPHNINPETYASWRKGELVFQDRPLGEILRELARYHTGVISVSTPGMMDTRVSGVFSTDDLPLTLRTIATALPAELTQTGPQSWRLDRR